MKRIILLSIVLLFSVGSLMADGERFVFISHAPNSDSWWNTIKNALKEAEKDMRVTVDYRNPPNGDLSDMARLIEQAAAKNYDGVITTIADYDVLKSAIEKVTRKGIPLITVNSGTHEQSRKLKAMVHIGQPEYAAGKGAGMKVKDDLGTVKSFLCVNHYATNPVSFERCRGFGDALGLDYKKFTLDSGSDPTEIEKKVLASLRKNPVDVILTLGPTSAHPTLKALKSLKKDGKIYFATFDLSEEITKGIESGAIAFGIDQQPFLQGYLPVVLLTLNKRYGLAPGNNINSGPGFVTKDNLELVKKLAGEYR